MVGSKETPQIRSKLVIITKPRRQRFLSWCIRGFWLPEDDKDESIMSFSSTFTEGMSTSDILHAWSSIKTWRNTIRSVRRCVQKWKARHVCFAKFSNFANGEFLLCRLHSRLFLSHLIHVPVLIWSEIHLQLGCANLPDIPDINKLLLEANKKDWARIIIVTFRST